MAYHQLHEIKRDRLPYASTYIWSRPFWGPEIYNTPFLNLKKTALIASISSCFIESAKHIKIGFNALNYVYEYPKNSLQWSIYIREIFKNPGFFKELFKVLTYGAFQHSLDAGLKLAIFHYTFGGTWSPVKYTDFNGFKPLFMGYLTGFLTGWTSYPLAVARKAYYADLSWPAEVRKGYRSPFHALLKIPFSEGPMFLFRGGLLHWMGNTFGAGPLFFIYIFFMDKFKYLYEYNYVNYSWMKFIFLNMAFLVSMPFSQSFFTMKEIMDKAPRERGGKTSFNTSGEAFKYLYNQYSKTTSNFLAGYWRWFKDYGAVLYLTIWFADNLGMMSNFKAEPNTKATTYSSWITD